MGSKLDKRTDKISCEIRRNNEREKLEEKKNAEDTKRIKETIIHRHARKESLSLHVMFCWPREEPNLYVSSAMRRIDAHGDERRDAKARLG